MLLLSINFLSDIDECEDVMDNNCDKENGLCINTNGSYHCSCNMGYSGDGINCTGKQPRCSVIIAHITLLTRHFLCTISKLPM